MSRLYLNARVWCVGKCHAYDHCVQIFLQRSVIDYLQLAKLGRRLLQPTHHRVLDVRRL
jgi:hypothetical protein